MCICFSPHPRTLNFPENTPHSPCLHFGKNSIKVFHWVDFPKKNDYTRGYIQRLKRVDEKKYFYKLIYSSSRSSKKNENKNKKIRKKRCFPPIYILYINYVFANNQPFSQNFILTQHESTFNFCKMSIWIHGNGHSSFNIFNNNRISEIR